MAQYRKNYLRKPFIHGLFMLLSIFTYATTFGKLNHTQTVVYMSTSVRIPSSITVNFATLGIKRLIITGCWMPIVQNTIQKMQIQQMYMQLARSTIWQGIYANTWLKKEAFPMITPGAFGHATMNFLIVINAV